MLETLQEQRRLRRPYTLVMDQDEFDRSTAYVLFMMGRGADAYYWAKRAHVSPSRNLKSGEIRDRDFHSRFFLWVMIRNRLSELRAIKAFGGPNAIQATAELRALSVEHWTLEKEALKSLTDERFLAEFMRPLSPGSAFLNDIDAPDTLFVPEVARILPMGVAWEALHRARLAEKDPAAAPYFDAVEAELAWNECRLETAAALSSASARQALHRIRTRLACSVGRNRR